jgi:hypothetical protein
VPNVLDRPAIDNILVDYYRARKAFESSGNSNQNYNMLTGGPHKAVPKLATVVDEINKTTNANIDLISGIGSYFDNSLLRFGWHQDHEPYYMWQIAKEYLNFWIPLIKEDTSKANIRVVPFDKLPPDVFDQYIFNRGAQMFESSDTSTIIKNDNEETRTVVEGLLFNEICEVPTLREGDALIMRGDLVHATEISNIHRVAVSIKALDCHDRVVTKEKFFNGSKSKQTTILKNKNDYAYHVKKFQEEKALSFRLRELFPKAPIHYSLYK